MEPAGHYEAQIQNADEFNRDCGVHADYCLRDGHAGYHGRLFGPVLRRRDQLCLQNLFGRGCDNGAKRGADRKIQGRLERVCERADGRKGNLFGYIRCGKRQSAVLG